MPARCGGWIAAALAWALVATGCGGGDEEAPPVRGPLRQRTEVRGAFEFAVVGDFGTGGPEEHLVAQALREWSASRPLEALVTTGDNVYDSGHPDEFDAAWRIPYGWVDRAGIPVAAALGNHDTRTDGGAPVMELLDMPGPWYTHRFGPVELFVLDTTRPHDPDQLAFLAGALRRSRVPWQVAVFHHPLHSCGNHEDTSALRLRWLPVLQAGGVDLVLSGHDHNYQRFPSRNDMVFVVSGGGGRELHQVEGCPAGTPEPVVEVDDRHHFLYVRASRSALRLRAVAVPGAVLDDVTLRR